MILMIKEDWGAGKGEGGGEEKKLSVYCSFSSVYRAKEKTESNTWWVTNFHV